MINKSKLLSAAIVSVAAFVASRALLIQWVLLRLAQCLFIRTRESMDIAFSKGGDMFYTEKCKGLSAKTSGAVML